MEEWSLTFTILSFIVSCFSLWLMWRIDQNTNDWNQKRAKIEDESNQKRDEKLDVITEEILNLDSETKNNKNNLRKEIVLKEKER